MGHGALSRDDTLLCFTGNGGVMPQALSDIVLGAARGRARAEGDEGSMNRWFTCQELA